MEKYQIQKLRSLPIMQVADSLGMGIRQKRALCIHHDDHHPSLAFNVRRNTCHCYSCGFSADTIALVMERFEMPFIEACQWLSRQFDVYIGDTGSRRHDNAFIGNRRDNAAASWRSNAAVTASDRRLASLRQTRMPSTGVDSAQTANLSRPLGVSPGVDSPQPARYTAPQGVDVEYYTSLFSQMSLTPSGKRFLLEERLLSPDVIQRCHIVSTEHNLCMGRTGRGVFDGPSLLIPYYDLQGRLVTVQSRYLGLKKDSPESNATGSPERQQNPSETSPESQQVSRFKFAPGSHRMMYGLERLKGYPPDAPILLTEGPSDCWTALTLGFHALAIPSATLFDESLAQMLQSHPLHIFPDQDEAGLNLYFELKRYFPSLHYHQLPEDCKDLSEYYLRLRRQGMTLKEASITIQNK